MEKKSNIIKLLALEIYYQYLVSVFDKLLQLTPVLLGEDIPLFGKINQRAKLNNAKASAFQNEFIQIKYSVSYL